MSDQSHPGAEDRREIEVPDFSMVIANAVHDMKNSLGMLLSTLDDLRQEDQAASDGHARLNTLQYEAERVHSDLVQLLGIYRLGEHKLSAHSDEQQVADFLSRHDDFELDLEGGNSRVSWKKLDQTAHGYNLLPHRTQADGFFISRLKRKSA